MLTRRALLQHGVGGVAILQTRDVAEARTVTDDDQRHWTGIVRNWSPRSPCVLDQINSRLAEEFPEEWKQPYRGFVYGFRGMIPSQETLGVAGQWVAAHPTKKIYLYASVPGEVVSRYTLGDIFYIPRHFPRETLHTPAGFAELWAAVRASQTRILHAIDRAVEGKEV